MAAALLAFIFLAAPVAGQQPAGTVAGTVVTSRGEPVAGVTVVAPGGRRAVTDAAGAFRITSVPAGPATLTATRLGFGTARAAVTIEAGSTASAGLVMDESAVALQGVVVSAARELRLKSQTPASVGTVGRAEIESIRPKHPSEILGQVPGVWISSIGGEGHMTAIRLPKGTSPFYLFLEDGVPTRSTGFFNHNGLYEIDIPNAERIEVLKGPGTALYGSDAIGGVIDVETRRASLSPAFQGSVEGGSNGWSRVLLNGSDTFRGQGLRADLNVTHSDGFRTATAYDRASTSLHWDAYLPGGASLRTGVSYSRIRQTDGSSVTLADFRSDPAANYNPIAYRRVTALRISSALEKPLGAAAALSLTPYARSNTLDLLPSWMLSYDPVTYSTSNSSLGMLSKLRLDLPFWSAKVIGGLDLEVSPGHHDESLVTPVKDGQVYASYTVGSRLYDYDVTFREASPYVQADVSPVKPLLLSLGVRYDHVGYDYHTKLAPTQAGRWRRPEDAAPWYDHVSPKLGMTYTFSPALGLFASYRNGFRVPSEGQLFRQGSSVDGTNLKPVTVDSYETGVRGVLSDVSYEASLYRMDLKNDILSAFVPTADGAGFNRVNANAGFTRHQGVELGLGAPLGRQLRADVSYSNALHTYRRWTLGGAANVDYSGNRQESAPRVLANARLAYTPSWMRDTRLTGEWVRVGSYFENPENTQKYAGHDLFNLRLNLPVTRALELDGSVTNLLDKRYAEAAAYDPFQKEQLTPGAPRSLSLAVQYRWKR
ncbi:MAG TPA: TonB-dependent receptor [Longimicrobiaceae bacterium]|jgi:outer membrane cobalamin receptor|nr:TonB-dependent receptor [Longimicrobiaceae bacterium]